MEILKVHDVSFKYPLVDDYIFENLNFSVKRGEFLAILGANGEGKTTLCNIIRGFIPEHYKGCKFSGKVLVDDKDITLLKPEELAVKIGFVFQNPFIQVSGIKKTVYEEIAFSLENLGLSREKIKIKVSNIIKELKIEELSDKNPTKLSGGQRQRVALASILVMDPDILVVDEPTSQLDPEGTEDVFKIINLMKEKGKTVILVEHKIDLIAEYADRIIVINDGKILFDDTPLNIFNKTTLTDYGVTTPKASEAISSLNKTIKTKEFIPIIASEAAGILKNYL